MERYFVAEDALLLTLVTKDSTVLDVGCGNGRNIHALAPIAKHILGIDYDERMIEAARHDVGTMPNVELRVADIYNFPPTPQYDLVLATYNLLGSAETEKENRPRLVQKLLDLTKPGGVCFLSFWSDVGIVFAHKYYPAIGIPVKKVEGLSVVTEQGVFQRFSKTDAKRIAEGFGVKYKIHDLAGLMYGLEFRKE